MNVEELTYFLIGFIFGAAVIGLYNIIYFYFARRATMADVIEQLVRSITMFGGEEILADDDEASSEAT